MNPSKEANGVIASQCSRQTQRSTI